MPADRLDEVTLAGRAQVRPLDLDVEIDRYGAATVGGLGISVPA